MQDLNGTQKGSGNRSYTDFNLINCTNNNCDRRREYLVAVSQLLIEDLQYIYSVWSPKGQARMDLLNDQKNGLRRILIGMGSLSYGELAGERILSRKSVELMSSNLLPDNIKGSDD